MRHYNIYQIRIHEKEALTMRPPHRTLTHCTRRIFCMQARLYTHRKRTEYSYIAIAILLYCCGRWAHKYSGTKLGVAINSFCRLCTRARRIYAFI